MPPGYEAVSRAGARGFAWATARDWLAAVLEEGTIYRWAGSWSRATRGGRGPVHVVDAPVAGPEGATHWAVRHYRRGGAVAPILGDRYWGPGRTRPERELAACWYARAREVLTPAVVAGAVYRSGPSGAAGFYRADLATEWIPGGRSLADHARGDSDLGGALSAAGALVRTLERAGIVHPDLNAGNVVLDEAGRAWVVDLDRARHVSHATRGAGARMLARLARSLHELRRGAGASLTRDQRQALRAGFGEDA